jgi:hypothetical protein
VKRKLKFNLDEDHNLILKTEYKVTEMDSLSDDTKLGTLLLCPHLQVLQSIHTIDYLNLKSSILYIRAPSGGRLLKFVKSYPGSFSCPGCEMTIFGVVQKRENGRLYPRDYTFKTRRSLGNAIENAENTWYRQTETSIENQYWPERRRNAYYRQDHVLKYHVIL